MYSPPCKIVGAGGFVKVEKKIPYFIRQMANGKRQTANGKRQMANGKWQMANGKSRSRINAMYRPSGHPN